MLLDSEGSKPFPRGVNWDLQKKKKKKKKVVYLAADAHC